MAEYSTSNQPERLREGVVMTDKTDVLLHASDLPRNTPEMLARRDVEQFSKSGQQVLASAGEIVDDAITDYANEGVTDIESLLADPTKVGEMLKGMRNKAIENSSNNSK